MKSIAYLNLWMLIISPNGLASNKKEEVLYSYITDIRIGDPWNKQTQRKVYGIRPNDKRHGVVAEVIYNTPISGMKVAIIDKLKYDFSNKAKMIADHCKSKNSNKWAQISCVSHSVKKTLRKYK